MLIGYSNGGRGECIPPTASATQTCAAEGSGAPAVDLAIHNPDDDDIAFVDVYKNGSIVDNQVQIPVGETSHVFVPFGPHETGTVSVNDTLGGHWIPGNEIFSQEFTFNCLSEGHAAVTIVHDCTAGGATFTFTNTGESPTTVTVTKNGSTIDTVEVPAGHTVTKTYAMNEDETATFRATGPGLDTGDQPMTFDCVSAQHETTTTPPTIQGEELARTGTASTVALTTAAGLLLMVGGFFLAIANRPLPLAPANARSRGR
jgi:hypothetical protein